MRSAANLRAVVGPGSAANCTRARGRDEQDLSPMAVPTEQASRRVARGEPSSGKAPPATPSSLSPAVNRTDRASGPEAR